MDHVDHRRIERLAYQLWQERGRPIGSPIEDWLGAEAELQLQHPVSELRVFALAMGPMEQ